MDEYGKTNMHNSNYLNSIIAKMANLDELLKNLRSSVNEEVRDVSETKSKKDELDANITRDLEKLRHDLYYQLNRMLDDLKNHQLTQRSDALKLQQEISILKKEKLDLYQRITDLQRRIADMEVTIGQDFEKR